MRPASASVASAGESAGLTTVTTAPAVSSACTFRSATAPPPITTQGRPANSTKSGKSATVTRPHPRAADRPPGRAPRRGRGRRRATRAVWRRRDVRLHVLMEARQAPLEILDEPPGELLGLRERELAELRAGAGDGPAAEWRAARGQPGLRKLTGERANPLAAHVDDDDVLHRRRPSLSAAVALGRIGHRA